MQRTLMQQVLLVVIFCVTYSDHSSGQKISFGAVTGTQLTDDFRTLFCPDLNGSQLPPPPGCPRIIGGSISVSNASKVFIFGPKLNVRFSPSFSVEVDALHRPIRTNTTTSFSFCPLEQLPACETPVS